MSEIFAILKPSWPIWAFAIAVGIFKIFLPKIRGFLGEKSVSLFLSRLDDSKYKIINNLLLQANGRTTQIDHVVVSNYGIFVIETKNYQGWILGNEYDDYWTQVIFKKKERFHNPIKQNYGHIQALKELLGEEYDANYISIVAFTTKADLKVKASTDVVYTTRLLRTIKRYSSETIADAAKEQIYAQLNSLNIDNRENRVAHVKAIKSKLEDDSTKVGENICPRCGGSLVLRQGKHGQFRGCGNYPKCRFIVR